MTLILVLSRTIGLKAEVSPDLGDLRDITGIEDFPSTPPEPLWPWILAAAGILALAAAWLLWKLRGRRRQPSPEPPEEWARKELDRIEALNLPMAGEVERFHTLIADVVRQYLERRYGVEAPRQTTREFLQNIQLLPNLTPDVQDMLKLFLEKCDVAKFARASLTAEDCRQTLQSASAIVHLGFPRANSAGCAR